MFGLKFFKNREAAAEEKPVASVNATPGDQDDQEIIAVLSAAIAAYSENTAVLRTMTRIVGSSAPSWSNAGRVETMNLRQI